MKQGISGMDTVLKNLNKELKKIEGNGVQGLLESGILVRSEGQKITPMDTGNLNNSWYGPTPFETSKGPVVEIGLTAEYAVYVHEMVDAKFQKPGAQAKFLETPLKALLKTFTAIIGKKTGIK